MKLRRRRRPEIQSSARLGATLRDVAESGVLDDGGVETQTDYQMDS